MSKIDDMKREQLEEEKAQAEVLFETEIEACYQRLDATRRVFRTVGDQETDRLLIEAFFAHTAALAVDAGQTRDEFLRFLGAMFDAASDGASEDEEPDNSETPSVEPDAPAS